MLNFIGNNFPKKTPDNDICNYLNRSEDLLNMESYWLSWQFFPAGPGLGNGIPGEKVDIIRAKH